MILSASQSRRFRRLYESFIIFCAKRLEVDILVYPDGWLAQEDINVVTYALEDSPQDIPDLVAAYVEENPDHLNRTDLREVSQWRDALYAGFAFIRDGADTYLIFGDVAFAVRGVSGESDLSKHDVDFVYTIIMPFDGVVTYGLSSSGSAGRPPEIANRIIGEKLAHAREERRIVRTARQYQAKIASVRDLPYDATKEEMLAIEDEELAKKGETKGEEKPTFHTGVLAGLSWDERKAISEEKSLARMRDYDEKYPNFAHARLEHDALRGSPTRSYQKMLDRHSTADLRRLATELGLTEDAEDMGRATLVPLIREATPMDVEGLLWPAILDGVETLEGVKSVFDAGGRMQLPKEEVKSRFDFPKPVFPATQLYVVDDVYHLVMCDEVREVLDGADWDALMARAKTFDDVIHFLNHVTSARGVARLEDAFLECAEIMQVSESAEDILYVVSQRAEDGRGGFYIDEYKGEPWIICITFDEVYEEYSRDCRGARSMSDMVRHHAKLAPRPVADMMPFRWTSDWLEQFEETRALMAFLDAHVPDDGKSDDYSFAECALDELVDLGCEPLSPEIVNDAFEVLEDMGLVVEGDEREVLRSLIVDYMDRVPKWVYNGWSARELRERGGVPPKE